MIPPDQTQTQLADLKEQIRELRLEMRTESARLDGIWWKIGLLAGIVSIIASEIYGSGVAGALNTLIGWWPL